MAGKQVPGGSLSSSLAGMSKTQLYDIMSQMKQLIEQNQQQARQILIQNPDLTKALFQAQVMLGMVQPQAAPSVQSASLQNLQQSTSSKLQTNAQTASPLAGQISVQEHTRKQQNQPGIAVSSTSGLPSNIQHPSYPSHLQQTKGHIANQPRQISLPQISQLSNMPPLPHHATSQSPSLLQTPMPPVSNPQQQPVQPTNLQHMPLQPPLPPHLRPPMPTFPHQGPHQNMGFQHSGAPQLHHSQYHSGAKPPPGSGPSFQVQPQHPMQALPQPPYQGGVSHLGPEYNQIGNSNQADRGSPWLPGLQEGGGGSGLLPGPPQFPGQMGPGNQAARPPLTPEMEKALLQQVMSLTPEQINQLPPEQRNQVLQLQQMLRK